MLLIKNASLLTMAEPGAIRNGAMLIDGLKIAWVGPEQHCPRKDLSCIDAGGAWITPAFIDAHSHLVYAGQRSFEFEQRRKGLSYETIAQAGGGILATVEATRRASEHELLGLALGRMQTMIGEGVLCFEIKSGYGLSLASERKILRVIRRLQQRTGLKVHSSFLGAHALPPEYTDRKRYLSDLTEDWLPQLHSEGLVDSVDAFCERIAFSASELRPLFEKALELGLPIRLHSDQLSRCGGSVMAAELGAISCDHLEYSCDEDLDALAQHKVLATLLPGAVYHLREKKVPPIDGLRKRNIPMVVASDANPGSSPIFSLRTCMNLAANLFRLTAAEVLAGVTCNAAAALGLDDRGQLKAGQRADFLLWSISDPVEIVAQIGYPKPQVWLGGELFVSM